MTRSLNLPVPKSTISIAFQLHICNSEKVKNKCPVVSLYSSTMISFFFQLYAKNQFISIQFHSKIQHRFISIDIGLDTDVEIFQYPPPRIFLLVNTIPFPIFVSN